MDVKAIIQKRISALEHQQIQARSMFEQATGALAVARRLLVDVAEAEKADAPEADADLENVA